jgi:hypothetical protein
MRPEWTGIQPVDLKTTKISIEAPLYGTVAPSLLGLEVKPCHRRILIFLREFDVSDRQIFNHVHTHVRKSEDIDAENICEAIQGREVHESHFNNRSIPAIEPRGCHIPRKKEEARNLNYIFNESST